MTKVRLVQWGEQKSIFPKVVGSSQHDDQGDKKSSQEIDFFFAAQPHRGRGRGRSQGDSPASFLFLTTILFHSCLHGDSLSAQEEAKEIGFATKVGFLSG